MKTLFAGILLLAAAQVHGQAVEADLDGNASALQASEMRPARQSERVTKVRRQDDKRRERVASR